MHARQAAERLGTLADWLAFEHLVSPAFEHAVMLKAKAFATIIVEEFLVSLFLLFLLSSFCPPPARVKTWVSPTERDALHLCVSIE
jgi:hypothetical protein